MKSPKSSDDPNESNILTRRRFIKSLMQSTGKITESQVKEFVTSKGQKFSKKSLLQDVKIFDFYWPQKIVRIDDDSGELTWSDLTHRTGATRLERIYHNNDAKIRIGELLSSIILGLSKFRYTGIGENADGTTGSATILNDNLSRIWAYLRKFLNENGDPTYLIPRLKEYWLDSQKALFLDAGTTTHVLANTYIKYFPFPFAPIENKPVPETQDTTVNRLEVITNDRYIFHLLGEQNVQAKVLMIGGRQHLRSAAVSGKMAEGFVRNNSLYAGMGIIGVSAMCVKGGRDVSEYLYAENEYLAAMKTLFLDRSKIKIVAADSSKFESDIQQGDTRICEINNRQIDLIVTEKANDATIDFFKKRQIPVISYDRLH
jgi:DeoR C terminal sensor domain